MRWGIRSSGILRRSEMIGDEPSTVVGPGRDADDHPKGPRRAWLFGLPGIVMCSAWVSSEF